MTVISVLLVTHDASLVDTVLRGGAACGVEVELVDDAATAAARWEGAAAVLVGSDELPALAHIRPARRDDVVVLVPGVAVEADFRAAMDLGAHHVAELPADDGWLVEYLGDLADLGAGAAAVWGFVGGSGGVGSTTLACAVAVVAARDRRVALIDLDPGGCGVEVVLGGDAVGGVVWSDLHSAPGRLPARSFRDALPRRSDVGVLSFGDGDSVLDVAVVREALAAARRSHDLVVLDLPRGSVDPLAPVLTSCTRWVLTAAATVGGVRSARRTLDAATSVASPELVVRASRRGADVDDVAESLGFAAPVTLAQDRDLQERIDLGLGPASRRRSPMTRAATEVLARLGGRS